MVGSISVFQNVSDCFLVLRSVSWSVFVCCEVFRSFCGMFLCVPECFFVFLSVSEYFFVFLCVAEWFLVLRSVAVFL